MTPGQIISWAREAELEEPRDDASSLPVDYVAALTRFAQLVASHKQEQCAKVCELRMLYWQRDDSRRDEDENCAAAIRALKD